MIKNFEKKNILLMIFLVFITLGIYIPLYFLKLKKNTDTLKISKKPKSTVIYLLLLFSILEVILIFSSVNYPIADMIANIFYYVDLIIILVLAFQFKDILNNYFNNELKKNISFSGVLTFFFTIFYLQYKINKMLE